MRLRLPALWVAAVALCPLYAQTWRGQIGAEVEIGEGDRSRAFTDVAKTFRPMDNTPVDTNGWPTGDFEMLFFDLRPYAAWNTSTGIDDPERYIPDWSGTYKLSFHGQATIASTGDPVVIADQAYDAAANLTTADVQAPAGTALLVLKFTHTQQVTDLKLIRPGYPADGSQIFTNEFLAALQPFTFLRFMGALDTNGADPEYDRTKPISANQKKWSDRHTLSDATQQSYGAKRGIAWEYVVALANAANKDIWINVPVSADNDYVRQLAMLLHDTLKPGLRIYLEHGNEVWNPSFGTYAWNHAAASADLGRTATADEDQQRHARRLAEIGRMFLDVFGEDAFGKIVRPVYAGWILHPDQYDRVLAWIKSNVGEPSTLFYAVAQTHYYNDASVRVNRASVDDVLNAFRADSDAGVLATRGLHNVAVKYGLKHVIYEGGPDILRAVDGALPASQVPALASSIGACRDARMRDIVTHDMRDNWFALGGAEYSYFTMSGGVSRWGCWGAVEDVVGPKAGSPKLDGILDMVGGRLSAPIIRKVVNAASYGGPIVPGAFASVFGVNFAPVAVDQWGGMYAGGRLPGALGGVSVSVNGKTAVVSYAGPSQINFIVPSDVPAGPAAVEVIAPGGRAAADVEAAEYSPAFFANSLDGRTQISAVFANTFPTVYVASVGAWPAVESRPASAGDWIQLYATGLGPSGAPFGRVLAQPYPIDTSQVAVTVDAVPATVGWAGLVYAGVFQVNVQVPPLERGGSLNVVLKIAGQATQADGVLTFSVP